MRERALVLVKEHYGLESEWFSHESEQLALRCNTMAMQHLRDRARRTARAACCGLAVTGEIRAAGPADRPEVAIKLLRKAEALTDPRGVMHRHPRRHSLRAVTLNNLGCYYKEQRKYHTALSYLQRALKLEADGALLPPPPSPRRTAPPLTAATAYSRPA